MTYISDPAAEMPYYRPKRIPRALRRHRLVIRWCIGIALGGVVLGAVSWRNVTYDRLVLEVGVRHATLDGLEKQLQQVNALIEAESSFPRISRWARDQNGWRRLPNHTRTLTISEDALTPAAKQQAKALGMFYE